MAEFDLTSYVSASGRGQWVVRMLALIAILAVVAVISNFLEIRLLSRIINREPVTFSEIESNDDRQAIVALIYLIALILTFILYAMWIYRAYRSLSALTTYGSERSAKWAVWGFIIPIMSLYVPYQIVREIWRETIPRVNMHAKVGERVVTVPIIKWWWGMWLLWQSIDRLAARLSSRAETAEALRGAAWVSIVGSVAMAIAAVLALQVIRLIDEQEEMRFRQLLTEQTTDD
jgi:hypothetical protein